jgi:hypothetical protein
MSEYEVTEEHFDKFVEYCQLWLAFFRLNGDWLVRFTYMDKEDMGEMNAGCAASLEDRQCQILLSNEWDFEPTDYSLEQVAFHEVCELLLMRGYTLAIKDRGKKLKKELTEENHAVIQRLTNSIFKEKKRAEKEKENRSESGQLCSSDCSSKTQTTIAVGKDQRDVGGRRPQIGFVNSRKDI